MGKREGRGGEGKEERKRTGKMERKGKGRAENLAEMIYIHTYLGR